MLHGENASLILATYEIIPPSNRDVCLDIGKHFPEFYVVIHDDGIGATACRTTAD